VSKWQAVIFDLDDTLYPERRYVHSGFRAVADWARQQFGFPTRRTREELARLFEQGIRGRLFDRWLEARGLKTDDHIAAMVRIYRQHEPQISPYAGVRELLRRLGREYRLGLLTDGLLAVQQRKVRGLGLQEQFDAIVYSDQWGREAWKPSLRPFEAILRRLDVPAAESVYVADNPAKDFRGARGVGMGTVRVRHGDGLHRDRRAAGPDDDANIEIADFDQLEQALAGSAAGRCHPPVASFAMERIACKHEITQE